MYAKLRGFVDSVYHDHIILDVKGVGFLVFMGSSHIDKLDKNQEISILIETIVREDAISLYGFVDNINKLCFKKLITIKGISPRLAQVILSHLHPGQINEAIISKNKLAFSKIPGIGAKIAERIITELKNDIIESDIVISFEKNYHIVDDALSALTNLGYNKNNIANIVNKLYEQNKQITINDLIKLSLKELAK